MITSSNASFITHPLTMKRGEVRAKTSTGFEVSVWNLAPNGQPARWRWTILDGARKVIAEYTGPQGYGWTKKQAAIDAAIEHLNTMSPAEITVALGNKIPPAYTAPQAYRLLPKSIPWRVEFKTTQHDRGAFKMTAGFIFKNGRHAGFCIHIYYSSRTKKFSARLFQFVPEEKYFANKETLEDAIISIEDYITNALPDSSHMRIQIRKVGAIKYIDDELALSLINKAQDEKRIRDEKEQQARGY
jgi:hypothetical protein